MLRFDSKPSERPRNYLRRREQWRLLLLVGALGAVIIAMQQIASERGRAVLATFFEDQPRAEASLPSEPTKDISPPLPTASIDPKRLTNIQDNTFFRDEEQAAWFYVLGELQNARPPSSAPEVAYAQLVNQPDVYRGKPVEVIGVALRQERVAPAANEFGIDELYRIIVAPEAGGTSPITLYTLRPLRTGGSDAASAQMKTAQMKTPIRCTGYFFKNQSYRWAEGVGMTPVVLARKAIAQRAAKANLPPREPSAPMSFALVFITAAVVSVALVAWVWLRGTPTRRTIK